jgi:hypothetical protein
LPLAAWPLVIFSRLFSMLALPLAAPYAAATPLHRHGEASAYNEED